MADRMVMLLGAMASVLVTWAVLWPLFTGIGLIPLRVLRLGAKRAESWFRCFWIGWALALVVLQLWHLWLPVDWRALALVAAIGLTGLLWHWRDLWHLAGRRLPGEWLLCLVVLAVAVRLANRAIGPPAHIDAGYYHLSAVQWAATYPIVPGLGNLHCPLGINCAHFLYVAMLDVGPWSGKSHHLANGLLLLVALAQVMLSIFRACRHRRSFQVSDLFFALALPALWTQAAADPSAVNDLFIRLVSSPTPDVPVFVLGVVMAGELLALLKRTECPPGEAGSSLLIIVALATAGTIVKVTFGVFGATAVLIALLVCARRWRGQWDRQAAGALILSGALVVMALAPWVVRSVILSGYIAYPLPVGSVDVEWRVPRELVVYEANLVRAHARWGRGLTGWQWLAPWTRRILKVAFTTVVLPCALTLGACCLALYWRLTRSYEQRTPRALLLFFVPLVVSAGAWFFTAPGPRFSGALFCAAAAGALAVAADGLKERKRRAALYVLLGLSLLLSLGVLGRMSVNGPGTNNGFHPVPKVGTGPFVTRCGLTVLIPWGDFYCWDAPLPCTPHARPGLCLRREGDLSKGFVLRARGPEDLLDVRGGDGRGPGPR